MSCSVMFECLNISKLTFVPPHPSLNAASCANSSPKPSMSPLMNGSRTLIAAPRNMLHIVGGEYNIRGREDGEDGSSDDGDPE